MRRFLLLALPVVLVAIAGCGSSSSSSSSATGASSTPSSSSASAPSSTPAATPSGSGGGTVRVAMKNLAFVPVSVHAKVGQTVMWTNADTPPHNVTYVSGPKFTSSSTMNPGATFSVKVTQPGTIHYFCSIHPFMKATVVVTK